MNNLPDPLPLRRHARLPRNDNAHVYVLSMSMNNPDIDPNDLSEEDREQAMRYLNFEINSLENVGAVNTPEYNRFVTLRNHLLNVDDENNIQGGGSLKRTKSRRRVKSKKSKSRRRHRSVKSKKSKSRRRRNTRRRR